MKYIQFLSLLILSIFFVCCEDMDDTYSKDIPRGKERYVCKCKNLSIEKGWKRFKLSWENPIEPALKNIKITWESRSSKDTVILDKTSTSYTTDAIFENENYEFKVCAVDINGKESIALNRYVKPFTEESEMVKMYRNVEEKYFFVDGKLILFLYGSTENMTDVLLKYYVGEELIVRELMAEDFENKFLKIEDINKDKPVTLESSLNIPECFDIINYEPYALDLKDKSIKSDFLGLFRYDEKNVDLTYEDIKDREELYINYDVISLEDVLNFPNLKRIYLAKNRYADPYFLNSYYSKDGPTKYTLRDIDKTMYALELMHEITGLEVYLYGDHFGLKDKAAEFDFIHYETKGTEPVVELFDDMDQWTVSTESEYDEYYPLENIIDNNPTTRWKPLAEKYVNRKHEIVIDMQEQKDVSGILFKQYYKSNRVKYMPISTEILYLDNSGGWKHIFENFQLTRLNVSPSEPTKIDFGRKINTRKIKFYVNDKEGYTNYVVVGDFIPFK